MRILRPCAAVVLASFLLACDTGDGRLAPEDAAVPVAQCVAPGKACEHGADCCDEGVCRGGLCSPKGTACAKTGASCAASEECCGTASCGGGVCSRVPERCAAARERCMASADCCGALTCAGGVCR